MYLCYVALCLNVRIRVLWFSASSFALPKYKIYSVSFLGKYDGMMYFVQSNALYNEID